MQTQQFQKLILKWFDKNGRKDLPWQKNRTPYRVWISEIMLQQTQVATVIPYFERFIIRFPDVKSLAAAQEDEVLELWAGLGYYARARNLHKTAKIVQQEYQGKFLKDLILLQKLPGIGRSTAGAIYSLGMNKPAPILDGNVKRVLTRLHVIEGYPNETKTLKQLWQLAEDYLPKERACDYTQAMMDIGSLLCTPTQPDCKHCPVQKYCLAYQQNKTADFPRAKPTKSLPIRTTHLLILVNDQHEILLEKRPSVGIWGGLWSLPEFSNQNETKRNTERSLQNWCRQNYGCDIDACQSLASFRHTFSHFHLDITPLLIPVKKLRPSIMESSARVWYNVNNQNIGLPAPIKKILRQIKNDTLNTLFKTQ